MVPIPSPFRSLLGSMALVAIVGALTAASPTPAAAQGMACWTCMWDTGQPGPSDDVNCVSQPEGLSDCQEYYDLEGTQCELSGAYCQELMLLEFSEDGSASRVIDDVVGRDGSTAQYEAANKTCDGVLLREHQFDLDRQRTEIAVLFAL